MDLTIDEQEKEKVLRATGMLAVPQINVNGEWIVGFDPDKIMQHIRQ